LATSERLDLILRAMQPHTRHTARDLANASGQAYNDAATTKFRRRLDALAKDGLVRKYVKARHAEYALTPQGLQRRAEIDA